MASLPTRLRRRLLLASVLWVVMVALWLLPTPDTPVAHAQDPVFAQVDIAGPPGGQFGSGVLALPNGNFVVADAGHDLPATSNVGAVSLYDGVTFALISRLTGATSGDGVGIELTLLQSGNAVAAWPGWDNGSALNAGAVTLINAASGITGTVSAGNSLVGDSTEDRIGDVTPLPNGHFVVVSLTWDSGGATDAGAVVWSNGQTGSVGVISSGNALVGSSANDYVGNEVSLLPNGAYVVGSAYWDNGAATDAGALTWCSGEAPCAGVVMPANSLVGSSSNDGVGGMPIIVLANGNYVVPIAGWGGGRGAVVWGSATSPLGGVISAATALVGVDAGDELGLGGVIALAGGNYVVGSPIWDAPGIVDAGAATLCSGAAGCKGNVTTSNSLHGSGPGDLVGWRVVAVADGNYVVSSPQWSGGVAAAGAVTWADGDLGIAGPVTTTNSLHGDSAGDQVGLDGVQVLADGDYLVVSTTWDSPTTADVGAVTWGNGQTGTRGAVSAANSLVGSTSGDAPGSGGVTALANGAFLVHSPLWDDPASVRKGAVTWSGSNGSTVGPVSAANSLLTSSDGDLNEISVHTLAGGGFVLVAPLWDNGAAAAPDAGAFLFGNGTAPLLGNLGAGNAFVGQETGDFFTVQVAKLTNGNMVVGLPAWDAGALADVGMAMWGSGTSGFPGGSGPVSGAVALVGNKAFDLVGEQVVALANGNYVVASPKADAGPLVNVGAVTWGNGNGGIIGPLSLANSFVGRSPSDEVGSRPIPLANGNLALMNSNVDNPIAGISNAGAVTLLDGRAASTGIVTGTNSVLGATLSGGFQLRPSFNATHQYMIVGSPSDNRVSIAALRWRLGVEPAGGGAGVVTSSPAGIGCGATCVWRFNGSQIVTLTATAALSSTFAGWSGACAGSAACVVTMDQPRAVIATFALKTFALTTNTTGTGSGSIGGLPANAGALPWGAQVTLMALADANSTFAGWSGACGGTAPCTVTMTAARQVTAEFALKQVTVALPAPSAGGQVTVQVLPAAAGSDALEAGSDAQPNATYPIGTKLRLTAVPNAGFVFGGWGGALSSVVNPQQVTISGPITITASFIRATSGGVYLPTVRR